MALDEVGSTSLNFWAEMLRRADRDLGAGHAASAAAAEGCLHVRYENLVANPIEVVRGVYAHFGWDFTSAYEAKLEAYIAKNAAERKAKGAGANNALHSYSLAQFGLTKEKVAVEVKWYTDKYLKS